MSDERENEMLERHFAAARREAPEPSAELLARVLADAGAAQARQGRAPRARPARAGFLAGLIAALGGWPALGGLAAASLTGLWLGISPPTLVGEGMDAVLALSGYETLDDTFWGGEALGAFGLDGLEEG